MAEEKSTQGKGEPFLTVHGVDMEGCPTATLRMWRFGAGDIVAGQIYIFRGLKVVLEKHWDDVQWRYIPRVGGQNAVECVWRTAVGDVSHVPEISAFFG